MLRIAVITQEDKLYIPRNVQLLCREPGVRVCEIIVLDAKGSLDNMRGKVLTWFGPWAVAKVAARSAVVSLLDLVGRMTAFRVGGGPRSLKGVARRYGIPLTVEPDANAPELLDRLRTYELDCVVSYSAPQVFKQELLRLPRMGCVNLHCSLLPQYRGLLPSFWVLYHGETYSGATVHLMGAGIDDGAILGQIQVELTGMRRMVDVLSATKRAGGDLMVDVLNDIARDRIELKPNHVERGQYHKWPTLEEAREFRRRGYSLA